MVNDLLRLISRIALGTSIAAHGAQKAWGAFGGPGPAGAAGFLESLGFIPGARYASAASATEIGAGALIALGLGGPVGPAALISTMIVAQSSVHAKNGFFAQKNGIELGVLYSVAALSLAASSADRFSLDRALGWDRLEEPAITGMVMGAGVGAAFIILAQRVVPEKLADAGHPNAEPADAPA